MNQILSGLWSGSQLLWGEMSGEHPAQNYRAPWRPKAGGLLRRLQGSGVCLDLPAELVPSRMAGDS